MKKLINVVNVNKYYGSHHIIKDLSFHLNQGDVLGFLGPNGAGKTTTMKMLTGYLSSDSGDISIAGFDVKKNSLDVKENIGYVPEGSPLYEEMVVIDFLHFCAKSRKIPDFKIKSSVKKVIEKLNLQEVEHRKIEELSKGFKRRVGIAQAIIHDPIVLILDEPTDGLDPNQKQEIRKLIYDIKKDKAIIISTHILDEAEALCNRVIILNNGEIMTDSTPIELLKQNSGGLGAEFMIDKKDKEKTIEILKTIPVEKYSFILDNGSSVVASVDRVESLEKIYELMNTLNKESIYFTNFAIQKVKLENIFKTLTQQKAKTI